MNFRIEKQKLRCNHGAYLTDKHKSNTKRVLYFGRRTQLEKAICGVVVVNTADLLTGKWNRLLSSPLNSAMERRTVYMTEAGTDLSESMKEIDVGKVRS